MLYVVMVVLNNKAEAIYSADNLAGAREFLNKGVKDMPAFIAQVNPADIVKKQQQREELEKEFQEAAQDLRNDVWSRDYKDD